MAGYLSESDFVMVEEGFRTRDLLKELTLGASQATTEEVAAFFVADLGAIVRKHFCFLKCLPRVRPFYAVKCNSSPGVLKVLAQLGLGFSCANKAEMELVQQIGVPASKIICANPCKQIAQIKYAAKHGIRLLSFDNEMELAKVVKSHPSAKMVLCIATDDSHSLSRLSLKFGVSLKSCRHLLENAKKSHVEVVGVSFHIGSGCPDPQVYAQSIADARLVFEMGTELGHKMHVLDLGGGFPGTKGAKVRFEELRKLWRRRRKRRAWSCCLRVAEAEENPCIASVINSALDLYFPEGCGVDIFAELGRYYVTSAFTVAVSIIAKKEVLLDQPGREEENDSTPKTIVYHLDEGVYGIFNSVLFDNICPTPILQKKPSTEQPVYSSSLWGPAVDGCDCVAEGLWLPQLHVGDWLVFDNMGAYTVGMGSPFGGTQACHITYAMSRVAWEALRRQLMAAEQEDDVEGVCKPLSCGWEITDTLCVGPVFTPASIM
ncbi:antizyme inhibitor 2 isoform X1 [Hylobates moloch]|uniref:antizyme inhibitor 2 isoform X1 n=2 Tax=Hylobates moloch TaxID=81572 RepID=UPI0026757222|nr:antizyme inhibitor 2 isoform X1 [Hylobates moloch]XP_058299452.1 antizyme inhibitor 2 isoform X1 [Hylobates moloch]XP_058299453.1 antizyme inhibitor 2 isoform X1 [Hylobates moloch]XP_058299457.1 antizyme inhibitor 2 isoform X1 [Hylobates moloch]XP_058299460.1 antizyme inhibitor 2 isoform X1 [Hylobates moloch]